MAAVGCADPFVAQHAISLVAALLLPGSRCACVAACCSVLQRVAACCSVLQRVAVCCGVLRCVAIARCDFHDKFVSAGMLQRVAACRGVLQCIAVCCSVL